MEEKIVEMFGQGCSAKEIETALSTNYQMVVKVLLKHGIDYKEEYKKKQEEKYSKALEMYKEGMQFKKICKALNIGPNQLRPYIKSILGEENWKSQRQSLKDNMDKSDEAVIKRGRSRIKYEFDENVFSNLEDEETCYWIGFLYADGTIGKGDGVYNISITLKESDREHLVKFCKYMNTSEKRIYHIPSVNAYSVSVSSYILWKRLKDLGFTSRKSWEGVPPKEVINNKHFWRGVIDGDGCIGLYKDRNRTSISLGGTEAICNSFKDFTNCVNKVSFVKNDFYEIKVSKIVKVKEILNVLYKDSNIYLERKYKKYLEFEEFYKVINEEDI